ncbi:MAG: hypothetical protein WCX71_04485 [Candidatus Buchananbacteria bacterium]
MKHFLFEHWFLSLLAVALFVLLITVEVVAWLMMAIVPLSVLIGAAYYLLQDDPAKAEIKRAIRVGVPIWAPALLLSTVSTGLLLASSWKGHCFTWFFNLGGRGTPWLFYYYWITILWVVVMVIGAAIVSRQFRNALVVYLGNWIRLGACVAIWRKDNSPANSLMWLSLIILVSAILYGLPSSKIDWEMEGWKLQEKAKVETTADTAEMGFGQFLAEALIGQSGVASIGEVLSGVELMEEPKPRYYRGWHWIVLSIPFSLLAAAGYCLSRRDEAAVHLESFVDWLKKKKEETKVTAGEVIQAAGAAAGAAGAAISGAVGTAAAAKSGGGEPSLAKLMLSDTATTLGINWGGAIIDWLRKK